MFNTLYKLSTKGKPQQWRIIVEGNSYYTEAGQVDGVITKSKPTICYGKNVGRANETSDEQQALLEAESKHKKKIESGYTEDINNISKRAAFYEPMLANKYKDVEIDWTQNVYIQPKLDGHRCIIQKTGATTRKGKEQYCVWHILKELEPLFNEYGDKLILDGELYSHEYKDDFDSLSSLIRKQTHTPEEKTKIEKVIRFHCYDCPVIGDLTEEDTFSARFEKLKEVLSKHNLNNIILVETTKISSAQEVDDIHAETVSNGYEGTIIRIDAPYSNFRSNNLLKNKDFDTDEFIIVDIIEGEGDKTGLAGSVVCRFKDKEVLFNSNIKASHELLRKMYLNRREYIGKECTIRYFGLTSANSVPRIPYVIDIDRWKYE